MKAIQLIRLAFVEPFPEGPDIRCTQLDNHGPARRRIPGARRNGKAQFRACLGGLVFALATLPFAHQARAQSLSSALDAPELAFSTFIYNLKTQNFEPAPNW